MLKISRFLKNFAIVASVCVCVWCAGESIRQWAGESGGEALLFAAGMRPETTPVPESAPVWSGEGVLTEETGEEREEPTLPDDGIVPFHSDLLPASGVTPDPGRGSGPVEEIMLDGGTPIDTFFVRDSTGSGTDLNAALNEEPDVHMKADGSVEVLIYHTHTSEAYSRQNLNFYYTDMETRTQDPEQSVVAAGEELARALEARGIGVVHDKTVNDSAYNGSYSRSWEVLQRNLEEHPGIQVTIDLHRDSMTTQEGVKYKPTVEIGGRRAAQAMLLAGCDADGSWGDFPDWEYNLRLMLRIQKKAQELYPGLMRPLSFSNSKYNMNATHGSILIEVGTEVNTAAEAKYTGSLLGEILAETLLQWKEE